MHKNNLSEIQIWDISCTISEIENAFKNAKKIISWKHKISDLSEKNQILVENIIKLHNEKWYIWNNSEEDNNINLSLESTILKEIIDNLLEHHEEYINEIKSWNKNIVLEKDHRNCDFALYLSKNENKIKNIYLKNIINLITNLHEKFHNDLKQHLSTSGSNIDFYNYLDNSLSFLKNILPIINSYGHLAFFDEWINLPNLQKLKNDIEKNNIQNLHLIKINSFSEINSLYWYDLWNLILSKILDFWKNKLWKIDHKLYRTGQMELRIIWNKNDDDISKIIEQNMTFEIELKEIGIKIPISLSASFVNSSEDLYDKWLEALYESKKIWQYIVYSDELDKDIKKRIENNIFWIKEIKDALLSNNVKAYFQWIRNNKTWEIYKYEALARIEKEWKVYNPGQFLEAAQKWLIIKYITKSIISQTVELIKETWFNISVNITESDLNDKKMMKFIENIVIDSWINAHKLTLEVLENITQVDSLYENIENIRKLGIKIAIDDFGTWYSNFSRLMRLKPDYLKIDWSLIKWIAKDKEKRYIVRTIVDLAHIIWSKIIAEFIDNIDDQEVIEELWIDYSQWYLFSKPQKEI